MRPAVVTLSFDDGDPRDLDIARLLKEYGLQATFYLPITNVEGRPTLGPDEIAQLRAMGFEIGAHGYGHRYLDEIPGAEVYEEVRAGKERLEQILGNEVVCFCYPGGRIPLAGVAAVRQLGFAYARTSRECRFAVPDPLLAPTTNHMGRHSRRHYVKEALLSRDSSYIAFFLRHRLWARSWDDFSLANLDYALTRGGIWHVWGHAFELADADEWRRFNKVLATVAALKREGRVVSCVNTASLKVGGDAR